MKKWLVGLVAAGLCAAGALAAQYSLVSSADEVTEGQYVIVAGQGDAAMKNVPDSSKRISAEAVTVTDGVISDPDASLVWTLAKDGDDWTISSVAEGGTVYAAAPSTADNKSRLLSAPDGNYTLWAIADSATAGLIKVQSLQYEDRVLQKNNTGAFFACYKGTQMDVRFFKEDSGEFSVALDPAEDFEVVEGAEATVTATAKNALGEVTYAWTVDGVDVNTDGNVLALPTGTVGGPYEVICVATDGGAEGVTAEASVKYTVGAAPQAYTVTVDDGIENGTVAVWDGETELASPADVLEGTTLTVVATPASRSYKVESITVTGETSGEIALVDGVFEMPAEDVFVTASFVERTTTVYALVESMDDFEAGADYLVVAVSEGNYTSAMKNEYVSGSSGRIAVDETVAIDGGAIETEDDSIVWTIDEGTADGVYTLYNAAAGVYVSAPSTESANEAQLVEDGTTDAAQWTIAFTNGDAKATIGSIYEGKSLQRNNSANNKYFANYKGGAKPFLFKKVGAGVFSISLDPADDFEVPEGTEATITASAKNAQGEVAYEWNVTQDDTPGSAVGNVWTIPADAPAGGPWTVYCSATDGESEADASVSFSIVAAPVIYDVAIDETIENGTVTVEPSSGIAGTEITVTATPDAGFMLTAILVNGDSIRGNTFELPEGGATVGATFEALPPRQGFAKITSLDELEEGEYILVGSDNNGSYGAVAELTGSTTVLSAGTVTIQDDVVENPLDSQIWTLSKIEGGWTIFHKDLGYLGYTGSKNSAMAEEEPSEKSTWTFSMAGDLFKVSNAGTEGRTLRYNYNGGNPRFACYSSDTLVNIALYKNFGGAFSVALDPAGDFDVIQGEEASITATAKNAAGEVTYAWTVDGVAAETDGPVLALPTEALGPHEVVCVATDTGAEGVTAEATVAYTVVPAPVPYAVTIAEGIENGSVSLEVDGTPIETPIDLLEGTEVTVVATPDDGFALESILVNGEPIGGDTFTVAGATEVSATFAEVVDYATLPFLAEGTPFTGPWQNPKEAGVTAEGLGTDYTSGDGRGAKFDSDGDWLQVKFAGTPETLSYALKGNGTSADCVFAVQESATGAEEDWATLATYPSEENPLSQTMAGFTNELSAESRYVRFLYVTKAVGNVALYDLYISTADFSVALDLEEGAEFEQGAAASVTATARHAAGEVLYAWTVDGVAAETDGPVLALPTGDLGEHEVVCVATDVADGATAEARATYTVVPPKPTYAVVIADGILNGYVVADVEEAAEGDTVTLTASPEPGYKLGTLTVMYGGESQEFTSSPAEFQMPAMEVLVTASFVERGEAFVKITTLDGLEEGEYVITGAAIDGEYAMLAQLGTSGTPHIMQKDTPEKIEADTIEGPSDSIVWTLAKTDDGWTIHHDAVGFVGYLAGGNSAGAEEEASAKSTWTIAESDGLFLLTNVGNTGRHLLYNGGSTRFACYAAPSSSLVPLALYKKSGPAVFAVGVDKTAFEVVQGTADSVTATAKNGAEPYSYAWTSETPELNAIGPVLAIPGTLEPGDYRATVTATDFSAEPQTDTAEVEFTVVPPPPVYAITVAEGIENGTVAVDKTEAEQGETVTVTATPAENYKLEAILVNGAPIEGNTFEAAGDSVVSATFVEIVLYPVTVDDAIEHGTVAADKAEAEAGDTVTLSCEPEDGWRLETYLLNGDPIVGNSFAMPEGEALVSAVFAETVLVTYVPVESEADFAAGEEYLLVAFKEDAYTSAMKNAANGTRIGVDEVEIAEDGSIATDNADIVWTIRAGAEEGQYVLFSETAGVYAAGPAAAGNNAQLVADGTDPLAQWTLDFSALPEVKIASVSYEGRFLQRNSDKNNKYFATYSSAQVNPLLYKKAGPAVFSITLDPADEFFEVEQGSEAFLTATPHHEEGVVGYEWIVEGVVAETTGNVLALDTAETGGPYKVTCIATDGAGEKAYANAIYSVVPAAVKYQVAIDEAIENGEVTADKATAAEGETVTVTATPAPGFELVAITVDGTPIEGDAFEMPAKDVVVSATFAEVVDYAVLPFIGQDTPYSGPWYNAELPVGMTTGGLGSDYNDGSAKFDGTGDWLQVKFQGEPGLISFALKGNGTSGTQLSTFVVLESADGVNWETLATYATQVAEDDEITLLLANEKRDDTFMLSADSRFVKFLYQQKGAGNIGLYYVYIGTSDQPETPTLVVEGDLAIRLGETFQLALGLEDYAGEVAWTCDPVGYIDPDTSIWWWQPEEAGSYTVTFTAMDGARIVATAPVNLTVEGAPALVFGGDDEGTVGEPVNFTVVAENVADPAVTFGGFLSVPEGSALTDADVVLGFPNVGFTPDAAGEYGLVFSAGTAEGGDYVEDLWIVTVTGGEPPTGLPEITEMVLDPAEGTFLLEFKGSAVAVYGTDDLMDPASWAPVEGAVIDGNTATVPMEKHFLRVQ